MNLQKNKTVSVENFKNPSVENYPVYTWAWNSELSEELIKSEIDRMYKAGIKAFYILPLPKSFRPTTMITELSPDYLTDEFIEYTKYAVEYASSVGMAAWLYDEGGWPSGSAAGLVVKSLPGSERKILAKRSLRLSKGEKYIPKENAVSAFKEGKKVIPHETQSEDSEITEYYMEIEPSHFADIYDPRVLDKFTELTHRKYSSGLNLTLEKIPYMFTDEPSGCSASISDGILSRFKEKYGYCLEDYIYVLIETESLSEEEYSVRLDYANLLSDLMSDSLLRLKEESNSIGLKLVGHLDNDHLAEGSVLNGYGNMLSCLRRFDIPGVDVILGHIRSSGNLLGNGNSFFPRLASSAAYQTGTNLALSESLSVYGNSLTFDEMRYILNYQLVRGINIFNLMLMPLTLDRWYGYGQRPYFHSSLPGFYALGDFNKKMARASYFMSHGKPVEKAALYFPYEDFWRSDKESRAAMSAYQSLGEELEASGVDFDIIDSEMIRQGKLRNGALQCGIASYTEMYFPENIKLPDDVKKIANALSGNTRKYVNVSDNTVKTKVMRDDNGNLYICLFNQSKFSKTVKISVNFEGNIYRFDSSDGNVYAFDNGKTLDFNYGECILLYASKDNLNIGQEAVGKALTLTPERLVKTREMRTPKSGVDYVEVTEESDVIGSFAEAFGEDFSGEGSYYFTVNIPERSDFILKADRIEYSAAVYVNERIAGYLTAAPYRLYIPREFFESGDNTIRIAVENLASNKYNATQISSYYPEEYLGPYNKFAVKFESEISGGGLFGDVRLIKL